MKTFWKSLSSLRLTIILITLLILVTFGGIFTLSAYREEMGKMDRVIFLPWLFREGAGETGLTWWIFPLLLFLSFFALNTAICTIDALKDILSSDKPWRRRLRRLVVQVVHMSFLLALGGHLISSLYGFRSPQNYILEGRTLEIPGKGLTLRLNELRVSSRDGVLTEMRGDISLMKDGRVIKRKWVSPNHPLLYRGIAVYLLHHGMAPAGIELNLSKGGRKETISLAFDDGAVSFRGYRLRLAEFLPDLATDREGRAFSASSQFRNPAQRLVVYKEGRPIASGWLLYLHPFGFSLDFDGYTLSFSRILYRPYGVLEINEDQGAFVALVGTIIFMIALSLLLFLKGEEAELVSQKGIE